MAPTRGGWAYLSLVSTVPGVEVTPRTAIILQFTLFEGLALVVAAAFGRWSALPMATAAVAVATAGSALMVTLDDRIRALDPPARYRAALFDSSFDVVMGLIAFTILVTYLVVGASEPSGGLLVRVLGDPLPALAVAFALFLAWDLCYRIGTAWWVSLTGLWRSLAYAGRIDADARAGYVHIDRLTVSFAALQLILVPFVWPDRFLTLVVVGHVGAVLAVSAASVWLLRR